MPRVYNLKKDNPNSPDRIMRRITAPADIVLPPKASTSQWMGKNGDQLQKGSCTGQMIREIRDLLYRKLFVFEQNKIIQPSDFMSSADFIYLNELAEQGVLGQDAGSTIHLAFQTLNKLGICLESQDPYSETNVSTVPTSAQYTDALVYKPGSYHNLADLTTMKACIASGYSCGFGILVYESFEGTQLANTGIMPMPKQGEELLGGHAQHGLDYDDTMKFLSGAVTVGAKYAGPVHTAPDGGIFTQNSWGSSWGVSAPGRTDRGCYWCPYPFFTGENNSTDGPYVSDMWMIHMGGAW